MATANMGCFRASLAARQGPVMEMWKSAVLGQAGKRSASNNEEQWNPKYGLHTGGMRTTWAPIRNENSQTLPQTS